MNVDNILNRTIQSFQFRTLVIVLLLLIYTIILIAISLFSLSYAERGSQALIPSSVTPPPIILLEPATGSAGTPVTVVGEGWLPDSLVLIYVMSPDETQLPTYAAAGVRVDPDGRFSAEFIPAPEVGPASQQRVLIVARAEDGVGAQANFNIVGPTSLPYPTSTITPEPTDGPTVLVEPSMTSIAVAIPTASPTKPAPSPTPIPPPRRAIVMSTAHLNIRTGPGMAYPVLGRLAPGQTADVTGVSADGSWWQIKFSGTSNGRGWISAGYVVAETTINVPVVAAPAVEPTPTPVPTPIIVDWRGDYYPNKDLAGNPRLVRNDAAINFNWGTGPPAAGLPADNFSVRWSRTLNFTEGNYRFHAVMDDGVRLFLDDTLILNDWRDGGRREVVAERWLWSGNHQLRLEYYEHAGYASIVFWIEKVSIPRPEADFDAGPRRGDVPLRVKFDNDSEGNYDSCKWEFGDDRVDRDCDDPRHTYHEAGRYTVRLRVRGPGGEDTKKRRDYITVRPVAGFAASPGGGSFPLTVFFANQSTRHQLCEWNFGDGGTSSVDNPSHTYTAPGVYTVHLRVMEADVWSNVEMQNIAVAGPLPTATATSTATSEPSPTATVTATSGPSPTATVTSTATPEPSPTATATSTATSEPLPTVTVTATATPAPLPTATAPPTATPEPSPTATTPPTTTPEPLPTELPTPVPSPTPLPADGPVRVPPNAPIPTPSPVPPSGPVRIPPNAPIPTPTPVPPSGPVRTS